MGNGPAGPASRARASKYVLLCFWWVGAKLGRFFLSLASACMAHASQFLQL